MGQITLQNAFDPQNSRYGQDVHLYAYITGRRLVDKATFILQADGVTPYYPGCPSEDRTRLTIQCAIYVGTFGYENTITIPLIEGGRIYFSVNDHLEFLLNKGGKADSAALVEPSITNTKNDSYDKDWHYMELTWNRTELYANISSVDCVSLPIAMTIIRSDGSQDHVHGIDPNSIERMAVALEFQHSHDGAGWNELVLRRPNGSIRRILSPASGIERIRNYSGVISGQR